MNYDAPSIIETRTGGSASSRVAELHLSIKMLPAAMRALRKTEAGPGFRLERVAVPTPGPSDVLVEVKAAGVCGTDRHIYEWDPWAQRRIAAPLTPGHEFMGVVAAIGRDVTTVQVGERVSAEGHVACGTCFLCRSGEPHLCVGVKGLGLDLDGAFADFVRIPARNVWKLDPATPDIAGAVFDPLGNAVHTVASAGVALKTVAIAGAGAIGLMATQVARAAGASRIFVIDVNTRKLAIAEQLGADEVFDARRADLVEVVRARTGGLGVDVLLEVSGAPAAIDSGLAMVRNGGVAALLGIPSDLISLDIAERIIFKGLTLRGVYGRRMFETWYAAQSLVTRRAVNLDPIITHVVPLVEFEHAFELMRRGDAVKVVFDLRKELR